MTLWPCCLARRPLHWRLLLLMLVLVLLVLVLAQQHPPARWVRCC